MAENDIYNSKFRYESFKEGLDRLLIPPEKRNNKRVKYWCRYAPNLEYFYKLFAKFEAKDISFVRRNRLCRSFLLVVHTAEKNLKELDREEIDKIVAFMHTVYHSPKSKSDFIKDLKYMWKMILPEIDSKGRLLRFIRILPNNRTFIYFLNKWLECTPDSRLFS